MFTYIYIYTCIYTYTCICVITWLRMHDIAMFFLESNIHISSTTRPFFVYVKTLAHVLSSSTRTP